MIHCGVRQSTSAQWAPVFDKVVKPEKFSAGIGEIDDFLGQILHESAMLERIEENLRYTTASRLMQVWPTRFPNEMFARRFVSKPEELANYVYGARMGNYAPGDGYRYRGRGLIMVTGKDNYTALSKICGLDLVGSPDLLAVPFNALVVSMAWWEGKIPDALLGNVKKITKAVNGGAVGLTDRAKIAAKAAEAIKLYA